MRDHAAITDGTERAQTLPVSSVDLRHSEVAEVALREQQILPPQGGAVWVEEHLKCRGSKHKSCRGHQSFSSLIGCDGWSRPRCNR